jgi:putative serine protease PepD
MTTTYDPFVPAGASGEGGYGRRRAEEPTWVEEQTWAEDETWVQSPPLTESPLIESPLIESSQPGVPSGHWTEDPRWSGDARPAPAGPGYAPSSGYSGSSYPGSGYPESSYPGSGYPASSYPGSGYPASSYPGSGAASPGAPTAPHGPPGRAAWVRPAVAGLVAVLIVVAAWQAYRIEGMTRDNQSLSSGLSAERNRTDQLEKQMAGFFDPEAVSSKVLPSVFRVRAGDFTGTAFSVGDKAANGKANLLTNYHVVAETYTDGGRKVSLERGATQIDATIVKVNKGKDLALLQANRGIEALGPSSGQVKPGQQVVVVGAPLGLDDTVTSGVISAYRPDDPDGTTIQFDAAINPGNSGGPLVNADHQVVGVATAKAKDAEGIGLAIPIKTACDTFSVC